MTGSVCVGWPLHRPVKGAPTHISPSPCGRGRSNPSRITPITAADLDALAAPCWIDAPARWSGVMRSSPSIVPSFDRDIYLVLNDFGGIWAGPGARRTRSTPTARRSCAT
jgi:hypothetical protein